jgi:hypothetical protein
MKMLKKEYGLNSIEEVEEEISKKIVVRDKLQKSIEEKLFKLEDLLGI